MGEKAIEALIRLLDKHLVPTGVGVVVAILGFYFVPDSSSFAKKLGHDKLLPLFFFGGFLVTHAIVFWLKRCSERKKLKIELKIHEKETTLERNRQLHYIRAEYDSLSADEKEVVDRLMEGGNVPHTCPFGFVPYHAERDFPLLYEYSWLHFSEVQGEERKEYKMMLSPTVYAQLKESKDKYGRVTFFE
ncbi:MAG: hypothetical protein QM270_02135 [Bacillota bacterium]|nr:hypothetical protein [Bacillota bacterium]